LCLSKTDAEGNQIWNRTYGGHDLGFGLAAQLTSDGGFILVGKTHSFGAGASDLWLIKTDADGQATF